MDDKKEQELIIPEVTGDDDVELSEEIADTAVLSGLLDNFISEIQEMFSDTLEVSLEGNPVRTHLELVNFGQDIVELAYTLRHDLLHTFANRVDGFDERGDLLRTQIVEPEPEKDEEQ